MTQFETELGAIRAIVFDTFGTIVDWRTSLIKALEEFGRKTDVEAAWDNLVDVVFGADLFRHYKPDPETYLGVCDFLGLGPEQVMMGAAHNYDLKAAKALGLRTAFIPRATEYGPGQKTDLTAEDAWDIVAVDLVDLAGKLAA